MDALRELLESVGARLERDDADGLAARWRGVPVRARRDDGAALARLRAAFDALADLPDPVPVAEIDLARHDARGASAVFVPVVTRAQAEALRTLSGDSFLVVLERDSGAMTVVGEDASGAPIALEHRLPRASIGAEHGLPQRSAAAVAAAPDPAARDAKRARLLPLLRCVRCADRAALADEGGVLRCRACDAAYPVRDGVPILLADPDRDGEPGAGEVSSNSYTRQALAMFAEAAGADGLVLDCGSGRPAENLPGVVHLELARYPNVDVVASADALPFADESLDGAVCESVLEHVPDPWRVVDELHRVLRAGAPVRVDAPFLAPFHGFPDHYHNFTQAGLERLLARFERSDGGIGPHQEPWAALLWMLRLAREGLGDEARRRAFDETRLGDLMQAAERGTAPDVLHPLDDPTRRALAAGFFFLGRKRQR